MGSHTWPRCQPGLQTQGYQRWLAKCEFPPHRARALCNLSARFRIGRIGRCVRTDCDGLDLDALLDVCRVCVVGLLVGQNGLAAERVHESGSTCKGRETVVSKLRSFVKTQTHSMPLMERWQHSPVPDAPQTIKQNWIPFLTFFFRRIIFCRSKQGQQMTRAR